MSIPAEILIKTMKEMISSNLKVAESNLVLSQKIDDLNNKIQFAMDKAQSAYNTSQVFNGISNLAGNLFKGKGVPNG